MGHAGCVAFLPVAGETIGAGEEGQSVGLAKFGTLDAMRSESWGDSMSNLGLLGLGSRLSFWVHGVQLELAGPDVVPGLWESVSHTSSGPIRYPAEYSGYVHQ
ncbi:hypothetical protein BKA58DRAFT_421171 [Alternaria rosae]|uniref:uncharacterized protein n=1 Tax=Alternaria rosae TaxID=1187941 RepID=UPI001E8D874B|nr:uncharacterized protein BKA58DRAFT_421171 [Alternaria rosae]KAH6870682.1 hypothetical protein BKA58DRAFT_421171 [Alternaria rosae]